MADHSGIPAPLKAGRPLPWSSPRRWWESKQGEHGRSYRPPFRLLMLILASIFIAEVVAMIAIAIITKYSYTPPPYYQITLIDAGIMTTLIFPVLYWFSFRPLLRHYEAEHHARQTAETMRAASQALTQTLDLDAVLNILLTHISVLIKNDMASISLLEDETRLFTRFAEGFDASFSIDIRTAPFFQSLQSSGKSTILDDSAKYPAFVGYPGAHLIRSWLGLPILANDQTIGVVLLGNKEPGFYDKQHLVLAEALVSQAAIAIQNAWLFEQVRDGRERLQSLSRRLVEIQETERRYIARELHDQAGQSLSSLLLGLGQLEKSTDTFPDARTQIQKLKLLTSDTLEELHRLAVNLRPASLDHVGLVPALDQFIKNFMTESGLQIHFKVTGLSDADRLPADVETMLYRIVQESLMNVKRHAEASYADVIFERRDASLLLIVEDNGKGFDAESPRPNNHIGLLGIQERAGMLGGSLTIESVPGQGTTLVVEVPNVHPNPIGG